MKKTIFLMITMLHFSGNAMAGWYQVSNYAGNIGKYPIHLSIQEYQSFGSGLNIEGSYYYDNNNSPIPLYGKRTKESVDICEIHDNADEFEKIIIQGSRSAIDTKSCQFKLTVTGNGAHGTWADNGVVHDVDLHLVGTLDNTAEGFINGTVEIPYWGQTKNYMLIGVYEKDESGIAVNKIKVINKTKKSVIQAFNPQEHDCIFGFFMTPIYMNVENARAEGYERILLNCYGSKDGELTYYQFDKKIGRFKYLQALINPK